MGVTIFKNMYLDLNTSNKGKAKSPCTPMSCMHPLSPRVFICLLFRWICVWSTSWIRRRSFLQRWALWPRQSRLSNGWTVWNLVHRSVLSSHTFSHTPPFPVVPKRVSSLNQTIMLTRIFGMRMFPILFSILFILISRYLLLQPNILGKMVSKQSFPRMP